MYYMVTGAGLKPSLGFEGWVSWAIFELKILAIEGRTVPFFKNLCFHLSYVSLLI
jgi:hypothetical protein